MHGARGREEKGNREGERESDGDGRQSSRGSRRLGSRWVVLLDGEQEGRRVKKGPSCKELSEEERGWGGGDVRVRNREQRGWCEREKVDKKDATGIGEGRGWRTMKVGDASDCRPAGQCQRKRALLSLSRRPQGGKNKNKNKNKK
ncbi:uncharacterized protein CIMG_05610 [Coccidioides immitis RS]|uniref:Uncharacterized protein n=2 Tax=Coccidioides immitis TaxID=5501 RepID=J3KFY7_COCIM|nr:uncharacterized protein CIMG_05610 [Coccidioides immitis RS]EAS34586.3 hypothetical protein CIMG_05610 [Coccidioides immitis RS]KMU86987.1 hypothetical protein CIHG_04927 [Coccidioides immitis H538.4]